MTHEEGVRRARETAERHVKSAGEAHERKNPLTRRFGICLDGTPRKLPARDRSMVVISSSVASIRLSSVTASSAGWCARRRARVASRCGPLEPL